MTDALVKHTDLHGLMEVAAALGEAGPMLPAHITSKGAALAVIMAGAELGIPPMAALRGIHLVKGKACLDYSLMVGLLRRAHYKVEWPEKSGIRCELRLTHPDGSTHTEVWDVDRAKSAGLWGSGTWKAYPEAMLSARCVSSAARAFAGDVLAGCYSMDEAREIAGDTHVEVVETRPGIPSEQTYDDPKQADEKERVKRIAAAYCEEVIPDLEERQDIAVQEMLECDDLEERGGDPADVDRERNAITANHRAALRAWCDEHRPRIASVFAHPATSSAKGKLWLRLRHWAEAAKVPVDDVKQMLTTKHEEENDQ